MKQIRQIILLILIVGFYGCKEKPTFPAAPSISFIALYKQTVYQAGNPPIPTKDSVTISIGFKDGDGDLGNNDNNNYFCDIYAKQKGVFSQIVDSTTNPVSYLNKNGRFQSLNPDGRQGPLEGTLNYGVSLLLLKAFQDSSSYTLKFKIYIKDNAGNSSNTIETSEVTLKNYNYNP